MNAVMDLTARAVSFITLIQDTILHGTVTEKEESNHVNLFEIFHSDFPTKLNKYINSGKTNKAKFTARAIELVWVSSKAPEDGEAVSYTVKLSTALINWICKPRDVVIFQKLKHCGTFPTPFNWREAISEILYQYPAERMPLAMALQYLPMQVVLGLGGGYYEVKQQRLLQIWAMETNDQQVMLTPQEIKIPSACKNFDLKNAATLLADDEKLLEGLLRHQSPLTFELIFRQELEEISKNRVLRCNEQCLTNALHEADQASTFTREINDPFAKAKDMQLFGLAFSGGGIRSATFNLGVLQGLAKAGLLSKFDYLSTVSGGGYIGSWLAAWISRDGSVTKVSDRLNMKKSPDPLGEEVRPIRWLRMFSNYFTPQASIMSVDSWTVGITWLRNTLLNQIIILLLFLTVLLTGRILYELWIKYITWNENTSMLAVYTWSIILLVPLSLLSGLGMQAYHTESFPPAYIKPEKTNKISGIILGLGFIGAFIVSAWLFSRSHPASGQSYLPSYSDKLLLIQPVAITSFVAMCFIAIFGRYDKCMKNFRIGFAPAWLIIVLTAAIAAFIGAICLALVGELMEAIGKISSPDPKFSADLAFTIGLPLVLEVFCITVVIRMALLGRYFPDERREWWGRMGAVVHRLTFIWFIVAGALLLGRELLNNVYNVYDKWAGAATIGGWAALVGSAVKAAFSSKTSGKEKSKSSLSTLLDILSKTGPYLFVLGLLIFLPALLLPLIKYEEDYFNKLSFEIHWLLKLLVLPIIIGAVTYILARQVGVNEFSMHHFYRNRLVRAFLGATRRRAEREKTANPFTGFDREDDIKIALLKNDHGYYGPYPILNTALNATQVSDLDRQDRKAESFIFSPLFCGFDFSMTRASVNVQTKTYDYGFRPTESYAYEDGPGIGTAMAISGAAVNPNQGYHSSPATAFLLTAFNVQMGWWIGNPRKNKWKSADPKFGIGYIIYNLIGKSNTRKEYVSLSDGGHFDNMGLYELVRRRCSFIVLGDGEQDHDFTCEGLANAIRRCRIDFGAEIDIVVEGITKRDEHNFSKDNYAVGQITYAGDARPSGVLLYIKSSITGKEPVDIREYSLKNSTFPHQTTGDQFFDEAQFESYRKLGLHIADLALVDPRIADALI